MKLKNSNCDETQKLIVMKPENSSCDETWKLKLWWNLKTQIVIEKKTQNSNSEKLKNLKMWQQVKTSNCDKTQIVTKLNNLKCDQTQKI